MHLRPATPADAERAGFINYHSWQQTYRGLIVRSGYQVFPPSHRPFS